jgi:hypothetical protein
MCTLWKNNSYEWQSNTLRNMCRMPY